jgi:PAS domain S-box-containing protein
MGIPLKLLIVEDSASDADLTVFKLKKHGYDVVYNRVEDGAHMWQALHEQQWDIVIADHNLPQFDSLRALQVLKDSGLDIPFIIVSGAIGEEIAVQAMKSGAKDYVPKNNLARLGAVVEREAAEARARASRKRAENALAVSEDYLRLAAQATGFGVYAYDFTDGKAFYSPEFLSLFGLPPDAMLELDGDMVAKAMHPDCKMEFLENMRAANDPCGSGILDIEYRIIHTNGQLRWLRARGLTTFSGNTANDRPLRANGVVQDITARKYCEESLRDSEERFRRIFDEAPIGASITSLDFRFIRTNETMRHMFGYSSNEFAKLTFRDITYPEDLVRDEEPIARLVSGDIPRYFTDKRYFRKDGTVMWGHLSVSPVRDNNDRILYFVPMIVDITERKQEEAYREIGQEILQLLNAPGDVHNTIRRVIDVFKSQTGFDAVGIRLQAGDDFPYLAQKGFPEDFLLTENSLVERSADGGLCRDRDGNVRLVCTCGLVISGKTDPSNPLFTSGGSFWTNNSFSMLDIPLSEDPRLHPRNVCTYQSYASIALIPIRNGDRIIGLLQLNDRRKGRFTLSAVELLEGIASHIGAALTRKQAEEALVSSEYNFRHSMDDSPLGIRIVNTRGETLYANKTIIEAYGYGSLDEFIATPAEGRYTPESYAEYQERKTKRQRGEYTQPSYEVSIVRKDGDVRHLMAFRKEVLWNGQTQHQVLYQDITDRKLLEDAQIFLLQCGSQGSGENFFEYLAKYLAQSLGMEYVCIDRLEGDGLTAQTVAIYNSGAYEPNVSYALKDTPCGDVVGKTICCFPRDVRQLFPKDAALQDLKAESYVGTTLWSFDGKPIGLIAIIGNKPMINPGMAESVLKLVALRAAGELEREMAEAENKKLREKSEISSRLAAVGEMAAGIAHEINNPLTGVIGFSELLLNNQDLTPDVREQVKVIAEGGKRVKDIVKRLLAFARQNKPMKTMASINELIETTLDLRSYVLRTANIEVVKQLDPDLPWQVVDPGQMQQVFLNIIVNAEYAMKKARGKGTLTITTEKSDDHVVISFRDDGPGISPEAKAKLFNPFFTTKGVGEGTGLGLSLSRSIILDHGGTIEVESESGQGANFIITLPVTPPAEEASLKAAVAAAPTAKTKAARILVVDDEEVIRFLLSTILTQRGHTVHATGDTADALIKLESASYDVVVMDIRMPGLSGMELYRQTTAKYPEMTGKFVFITGDTSDQVIRSFLEENNLPYITKPFDRDTLMKKVNGLL